MSLAYRLHYLKTPEKKSLYVVGAFLLPVFLDHVRLSLAIKMNPHTHILFYKYTYIISNPHTHQVHSQRQLQVTQTVEWRHQGQRSELPSHADRQEVRSDEVAVWSRDYLILNSHEEGRGRDAIKPDRTTNHCFCVPDPGSVIFLFVISAECFRDQQRAIQILGQNSGNPAFPPQGNGLI